MKFEHDPKKSRTNREKHDIALEAGEDLWETLAIEAPATTIDEPRFFRIGKIKDKCYTCVFTKRNETTRLISLRRSRKKEEQLYYEYCEKN